MSYGQVNCSFFRCLYIITVYHLHYALFPKLLRITAKMRTQIFLPHTVLSVTTTIVHCVSGSANSEPFREISTVICGPAIVSFKSTVMSLIPSNTHAEKSSTKVLGFHVSNILGGASTFGNTNQIQRQTSPFALCLIISRFRTTIFENSCV